MPFNVNNYVSVLIDQLDGIISYGIYDRYQNFHTTPIGHDTRIGHNTPTCILKGTTFHKTRHTYRTIHL